MFNEQVAVLEKEKQNAGKPWKIVGRHKTFELADRQRFELMTADTEHLTQVKVKVQAANSDNPVFVVKQRNDPSKDVEVKSDKKKNGVKRPERAVDNN